MIFILQDYRSNAVLEAFEENEKFYRTLSAGNFIPLSGREDLYEVKEISLSKKKDSCLVKVKPNKQSDAYRLLTDYSEENENNYYYLKKTENQIDSILSDKTRKTHVHSIARKGITKIAKKFGEESVELVIESGKTDEKDFRNEAADVLYYYLILIHERGYYLRDILKQLKKQKRKN